MKLLITGATGLVGRAIVEKAHTNDISVNYLTTNKSKIITNELYKGFYWNPSAEEIDLTCFEGVTHIINLAGASIAKKWTKAHKHSILESRIKALQTLEIGLSKVDRSSILSIVSASAIGIYPHSVDFWYNEDYDEIDDSFLSQVVSHWEKAATNLEHFNIPLAKIRIGLVLSNDGGALPKMVAPIQKYLGAAFASGRQWQSWIHVKDLANLFLFVGEEQLAGIYNGVAPNPVTNMKLTKLIAETVGTSIILPKIPSIILRTLLGQMSTLLVSSQRVGCTKILNEGFSFNYPNIGIALQNLIGTNTGS